MQRPATPIRPARASAQPGSWDTDGVRDSLRDCVTGHLDDSYAVLVVDEPAT